MDKIKLKERIKKINIFRIILSFILIGLIYTETGIWTTLFVFLITLRCEIEDIKQKGNKNI